MRHESANIIGGIFGTSLTIASISVPTVNQYVTLLCGISTAIITVPPAFRLIRSFFVKPTQK